MSHASLAPMQHLPSLFFARTHARAGVYRGCYGSMSCWFCPISWFWGSSRRGKPSTTPLTRATLSHPIALLLTQASIHSSISTALCFCRSSWPRCPSEALFDSFSSGGGMCACMHTYVIERGHDPFNVGVGVVHGVFVEREIERAHIKMELDRDKCVVQFPTVQPDSDTSHTRSTTKRSRSTRLRGLLQTRRMRMCLHAPRQ